MNRRKFISKSTVASAGIVIMRGGIIPVNPVSKIPFSKIGINLITVKKQMEQNILHTLLQLKEMGYNFIETRPFDKSDENFLKAVKKSGLRYRVMGYGMGKFTQQSEELKKQADMLGVEYLISYYPWSISPGKIITKDVALRTSEVVNKVGKEFKKSGFRFLWHNHAWAFNLLEDGSLPFDILMENTEPDYSGCQLDVYWAIKAKASPVELLKKYKGRIDLLHIKDMDSTPEKKICCVGDGIIDFTEIIKVAKASGSKHLIVEQEKQESNGPDCAQRSLNAIREICNSIK